MKILLILLTVSFGFGCANKDTNLLNSEITPGATTVDTLVTVVGTPTAIEESVVREGATFYRYPENSGYEVTEGVVTAAYKKPDPSSDESKLQYWLQLWKNEHITIKTNEDSRDHHGRVDREYSIPNGQSVIYSEALGRVSLVVNNETH